MWLQHPADGEVAATAKPAGIFHFGYVFDSPCASGNGGPDTTVVNDETVAHNHGYTPPTFLRLRTWRALR